MALQPPEPPPDADLALLANVGLEQAPLYPFARHLRWTSADLNCGVIYAASVPLKWGAYWKGERGELSIVWGYDLPPIILVLHAMKK